MKHLLILISIFGLSILSSRAQSLKVTNIGATIYKFEVQNLEINNYRFYWNFGDDIKISTKSNNIKHYYECSSKKSYTRSFNVIVKKIIFVEGVEKEETIASLKHSISVPQCSSISSNAYSEHNIYDVSLLPNSKAHYMKIPFYDASSPFDKIGFVKITSKMPNMSSSWNQIYYTAHCPLDVARNRHNILYQGLHRQFYLNALCNTKEGKYYDGLTKLEIQAYDLAGRSTTTKTLNFIGVKCSETTTSETLKNCKNYHINDFNQYWSGTFILTSTNFNDDNYSINACNTITLKPGCIIKPTSDNSVLFRIESDIIPSSSQSEYNEIKITKSTSNDGINELSSDESCYEHAFNLDKLKSENNIKVENNKSQIFPNPVINTATLLIGSDNNQYKVSIYSTTGQVIKEIYLQNSNKVEIDFSHFSPGTYLISIVGDLHNETIKFLKK